MRRTIQLAVSLSGEKGKAPVVPVEPGRLKGDHGCALFESCRARWIGLSLVAELLLLACAVAPARLASLSDLDICRGYGVYSHWFVSALMAQGYKQEMERRKLLTPEEWTLAAEQRIQKGMSQCALYASWGKPVREYRTEQNGNVQIRHVYRMGWSMRPGSVFTKHGKVDGWSYELKRP